MAAVEQRSIAASWERWCFSHFYSKCVSISSFPDRLLFGPPKAICWASWTRMVNQPVLTGQVLQPPPILLPLCWTSWTLLVSFMYWITSRCCIQFWGSELNPASRYSPTSALSREADFFPCCSGSAPVNAAEGALGICCHKETLLAHMLLDPLSVHQALLNITGSHSVSSSSSARVFSFPAGGLAICSQWILRSFSPFLQPAGFSVSGSPAVKSVNWFLPV